MAVQDDAREEELIALFGLSRPANHTRGGIDALLKLDGRTVPFEIKSSTEASVTTVRDFGPDHLAKWVGKHWLFGFYDRSGEHLQYSLYGSPAMMQGWISEMEEYVRPDYVIAEGLPERLDRDLMHRVAGDKDKYSLEDAQAIQKRQYKADKYRGLQDVRNGYSPARMEEIVRDRARYLLNRGATLNNPHIPANYFEGWERIVANHAARLRELVREAL